MAGTSPAMTVGAVPGSSMSIFSALGIRIYSVKLCVHFVKLCVRLIALSSRNSRSRRPITFDCNCPSSAGWIRPPVGREIVRVTGTARAFAGATSADVAICAPSPLSRSQPAPEVHAEDACCITRAIRLSAYNAVSVVVDDSAGDISRQAAPLRGDAVKASGGWSRRYGAIAFCRQSGTRSHPDVSLAPPLRDRARRWRTPGTGKRE